MAGKWPTRRATGDFSKLQSLDAVESGSLVWMQPEPIEVPACCGQQRGVWFPIRQGLRAVQVQDERGQLRIYLLIQPVSHYYHVMTRSEWMPVLIDETI
jgi:hypothetical protein